MIFQVVLWVASGKASFMLFFLGDVSTIKPTWQFKDFMHNRICNNFLDMQKLQVWQLQSPPLWIINILSDYDVGTKLLC